MIPLPRPYLSVCLYELLKKKKKKDRQITDDCHYHCPHQLLVFLNQLPHIMQVKKKTVLTAFEMLVGKTRRGAYLKMKRSGFFFFFPFFF